MSRKGENIYKRKDGRWEGRYIKFYDYEGKAKYGYIYGKSYGEVKTKIFEVKSSINNISFIKNQITPLYSEILWAWLKSKSINVKESTYMRYKQLIENHINPVLGKYPIYMISNQLIENYIDNKIKYGRIDGKGGLSSKTVSDILTIIKSSVDYASYNGLGGCCNLNKVSVKKRDNEIRVLTIEEQKKLTNLLLIDTDLSKLGTLLSLYTGIRIGELCALRWKNFNMDEKILLVKETMQRIQNSDINGKNKTKIIITEPKSKSSVRKIPLPVFLIDIIKKHQGNPEEFILTGYENKYVEPRTMQNRFQQYIKNSGIKNANYHSLRHTFATRCVEVGFEIKSLSEILGHSNVNITLNRYVHSSIELKQNNMNKLYMLI